MYEFAVQQLKLEKELLSTFISDSEKYIFYLSDQEEFLSDFVSSELNSRTILIEFAKKRIKIIDEKLLLFGDGRSCNTSHE